MSALMKMDHLNLVNVSFCNPLVTWHLPAAWDLFEALYENNIAVIHSQGNQFDDAYDEISKPYSESNCRATESADCEFTQTDDRSRYPFNINVGALDSLGAKYFYSSTGANLWVTGFGGALGAYSSYPDFSSSAALVTTLSSYDPEDIGDPDEDSPWRTEVNKHYTNRANGTSSAADSVSGAVALAYQARPHMTVSELRYLLAKTAKNDTVLPSLDLTQHREGVYDDVYGEKIVYDYGIL